MWWTNGSDWRRLIIKQRSHIQKRVDNDNEYYHYYYHSKIKDIGHTIQLPVLGTAPCGSECVFWCGRVAQFRVTVSLYTSGTSVSMCIDAHHTHAQRRTRLTAATLYRTLTPAGTDQETCQLHQSSLKKSHFLSGREDLHEWCLNGHKKEGLFIQLPLDNAVGKAMITHINTHIKIHDPSYFLTKRKCRSPLSFDFSKVLSANALQYKKTR